MTLFSRVKCIGKRLSHVNVYKRKNINQQANNILHIIRTEIYYTQQVLVYKQN